MKQSNYSPVPIKQIPLQEFIELSKSIFFSWPLKGSIQLNIRLFITWLLFLPIFLIIISGSYSLKNDLFNYLIISFLSSLLIPFILLIRQLLGWSYVYKRLKSEAINYEETDWHDGQSWKKPIIWQNRDKLVANNDLMPILTTLKRSLFVLTLIFIFSSSLIVYKFN
ncbi:CGLD27 family protein [Prochlorococcus marinus]|uniref:CGLD27 family protein n=1 Tax=Prochlorococcus marinus TaxID=1219 RepID=UPI0022B376A0|nr:CGLD27 family protein [Prochlorococcus marinus]